MAVNLKSLKEEGRREIKKQNDSIPWGGEDLPIQNPCPL